MTVQINARVSDALGAELDRMASERSIERGALARDILAEAVGAWKEGRAMFERPETLDPTDLRHIVARIEQHDIALDRVLRRHDKREAELAQRARDDTLGVSEARGAIVAQMGARLDDTLRGAKSELAQMREELIASAKAPPALAGINDRLDQIERLASRERVHQPINIGFGEWRWPVFALLAVSFLIMGGVAFELVSRMLPDRWLAIPGASRMLGGGERAVCRLIDYQYDYIGLTDCRVERTERSVTVVAERKRTR